MSSPTLEVVSPAPSVAASAQMNEVRLVGSVADTGEHRLLAGGAQVVRWTLRVPRGADKAGSDLIDCVALETDLQERALSWPMGASLAVTGAIRRRFFRSGGRTATRVEVEADQVQLLDAEESAGVVAVEQPDQ